MHSRPLGALVGGTTALLSLLTLSAGPALAVDDDRPETSESDLLGVDSDGLGLPGARSSSTATSAATGSLMTNVPSLLRAPDSHTQVSTAFTQAVAHHVRGTDSAEAGAGSAEAAGSRVTTLSAAVTAPATTASDTVVEAPEPPSSGSVAETTEDGITIAALSGEMELPDDAPGVVGLVYDQQSDVEFEIRTRQDGEWSDWNHIHVEDAGAEQGSPGTDPYYVAGAQSLQVRILGDGWEPSGTRILLVDPKTKASDAEAVRDNLPVAPAQGGTAEDPSGEDDSPAQTPVDDGTQAAQAGYHQGHRADGSVCTGAGCSCPLCAGAAVVSTSMSVDGQTAGQTTSQTDGATAVNTAAKVKKVEKPTVRSRKDWGASTKLGSTDHAVAKEATVAVVHHSAGANDYDAEDVPAILRGIHTFHVEGRGWDDVGYNMFADKYGRLWEGRAGGLDKAIVGAHAAGYNTGTFGISVLGSYEKKAPPQKTLDAVAGAIAWKLSLSGTSADAKSTVAGERMRTVIGHRDVGQTSCPGAAFYKALGDVRETAVEIQQGERDVNPTEEKKSDTKKDSDSKKESGEKSKDKGSDTKSGGEGSGDDGLGGDVADLTPGVVED
jgi:hypothetical protein